MVALFSFCEFIIRKRITENFQKEQDDESQKLGGRGLWFLTFEGRATYIVRLLEVPFQVINKNF